MRTAGGAALHTVGDWFAFGEKGEVSKYLEFVYDRRCK